MNAAAAADVLPRVIVTADGITAFRSLPLAPTAADALVADLERSPEYGEVWTERAGNSPTLLYVCALPVTADDRARLASEFVAGEIAKAVAEKDRYQWIPLGAGRWRVVNMNHRTKGFYSSWEISEFDTCSCPRFAACQFCKHVASIFLDRVRELAPENAAPTVPYVPQAINPANTAAYWSD